MKKEFIPYILPIITIITIFILSMFNSNDITGFAVKELNDKITGKVVIFTDNSVVIPKDATVELSVDMKNSSMSVEEFIKKNGSSYEIKTGSYPILGYYGAGYSGNHNYALDLEAFNLGVVESKDIHILNIKVYYKDRILSESVREIKK